MRAFFDRVRRAVLGAPVASDSARQVALRTRVAIAVFGTGMLSTVAYAPDAVLDALWHGGESRALPYITAGVVGVIVVLAFAYRSNVRNRPDSRADYGLVRDKLGANAGVVTGSALLIDYLFTVAVSVAAAAQFIGFVVPELAGARVGIALILLAVMTYFSLRGARERVRIVSIVWYAFLVVTVVAGIVAVINAGPAPATEIAEGPQLWSAVIALAGAVASGSVMMTGIEHLAASAPAHAEPQGKRAGRTVVIVALSSAAAFAIVSYMAWHLHILSPSVGPVILRAANAAFGNAVVTAVVAFACIAILYAAASGVFRRFAALTSVLASDGYLPRQLAMRNDRLVYRGAVLGIAIAAVIVVVGTRASIDTLIHMYVIGVFSAIVLSQVAMTRLMSGKIAVETDPKQLLRLRLTRVLHIAAVVVSGLVLGIVAVFNFINGAYIAIVLIVALVITMRGIRKHYVRVAEELRISEFDSASALPSATHGLVLVAQLHRPALRAISYAKAARHTSLEAIAVQVDGEATRRLQSRWSQMSFGVPLVILDSPYRDIVGPVMEYVKAIHRDSPRDVVVVYVPEYIVGHWWEQLLHNRSTQRLCSLLLRTPGVIVSAVPWHLESSQGSTAGMGRVSDHERD